MLSVQEKPGPQSAPRFLHHIRGHHQDLLSALRQAARVIDGPLTNQSYERW